jgi:methyl-accepting chemotaxis protein
MGVFKKGSLMARSSDAIFPLSLVKDKTFQMRQIRRVLLLTLFFIVQSTLILGVFYHYILGELVAGTAPLMFASEDLHLINEAVPSTQEVMSRWLIIMLMINAAITCMIGVYIMRKLGNPLLAIRRALQELGEGNLDVRLRSGDSSEFAELTTALNKALEQIQSKVDQARNETRILDDLDQQPQLSAQEVEQALANCRDALSFFNQGKVADDEKPAANG